MVSLQYSNPFDVAAIAKAEVVAERAIADLLDASGRPRGVVVTAPAGAGKSQLIARTVDRARARGHRVAVAAPTNEQAFGLVRAIAEVHCSRAVSRFVSFVPANTVVLPDTIRMLPGVRIAKAKEATRHDLIVGTLSKLGDAFARGDLAPFDMLLIDEAFQADSAKYFALGDLAPVHLLVGDPGQISPFATVADPNRWRGLAEDPLQTAVGVLLRNHPGTPLHGLPITRRLDTRGAQVASTFYPDLPFAAVVRPGVRVLGLARNAPTGRKAGLDAALSRATNNGWAHVELPHSAVIQIDPQVVTVITDMVSRLFERSPWVQCERQAGQVPLRPSQVAVGVSHCAQRDYLRAALDDRGLGRVIVETANKLQGLEFEMTFVWHPLSGLPEVDEFHLDPGRMCVLLTRHRHACVVIGRTTDRDLLHDRPPPPTAAYLGWDPDPVLNGWETHHKVFTALEPHRLSV